MEKFNDLRVLTLSGTLKSVTIPDTVISARVMTLTSKKKYVKILGGSIGVIGYFIDNEVYEMSEFINNKKGEISLICFETSNIREFIYYYETDSLELISNSGQERIFTDYILTSVMANNINAVMFIPKNSKKILGGLVFSVSPAIGTVLMTLSMTTMNVYGGLPLNGGGIVRSVTGLNSNTTDGTLNVIADGVTTAYEFNFKLSDSIRDKQLTISKPLTANNVACTLGFA